MSTPAHTSRRTGRRYDIRGTLAASLLTVMLTGPCLAAAGTASAADRHAERSVGTPEQIAWVRRAAGNFVSAELAGNGAGACGILAARMRGAYRHETCAQRWDAKLAAMLSEPGERGRLRKQLAAIASARVVVRGNGARIDLPTPLIDRANRFVWSESCWMLTRP